MLWCFANASSVAGLRANVRHYWHLGSMTQGSKTRENAPERALPHNTAGISKYQDRIRKGPPPPPAVEPPLLSSIDSRVCSPFDSKKCYAQPATAQTRNSEDTDSAKWCCECLNLNASATPWSHETSPNQHSRKLIYKMVPKSSIHKDIRDLVSNTWLPLPPLSRTRRN